MTDSPTQRMQCMEVGGGSQLTSSGVELAGLDVWVYSKPFGQAQRGGDVYDVSSCASGRISSLLLADVSGHGKSVASTAADLRTLMRRFVNRLDQKDLASAFLMSSSPRTPAKAASLRRSLPPFSHPAADSLFATPAIPARFSFEPSMAVGPSSATRTIPKRRGRATYLSASFSSPYYEHLYIELDPGRRSGTSYTDALIESCDADAGMLLEEGLLRIVNLLGDIPAEKLIASLLQEIAERFPKNSLPTMSPYWSLAPMAAPSTLASARDLMHSGAS